MTAHEIDEEDVRLTAYFLWEQEGRPNSDPSDFWHKALEIHRRAHANGLELDAGLESQQQLRTKGHGYHEASDPHPAEEGDPYGTRVADSLDKPAG